MLEKNEIIGMIPSVNLHKSREFYEGILGLEFIEEDGFAAIFKANNNFIRVINVEGFKPQPFAILSWEVEKISKKVSTLKEKGVVFEQYPWMGQNDLGIWTAPNKDKVAWFKDTDGNVLSLSEHVNR